MIGAAELTKAQAAGLDALDAWDRERTKEPEAVALTEAQRWELACERKLDFARHHHRTHQARPLDLSAPWLRAIYDCVARYMVVRKSVQCGVSEYIICRELAEADAGRSVIHVLPNYVLRNRFVATRVDRPLRFVPLYRERARLAVGEASNRAFKLFGDGALHFLGSNTADQFIEVAGDTAIVDEVDRCDAENLTLLPDRLSAAGRVQAWLQVGNPTHDGFGISALYDDSDQCEWQVRCAKCGRYSRVDWFEHVVEVERDDEGVIVGHRLRDETWSPELDRAIRCYCPCGEPFDRFGRGRWEAKQPGHPRRGYHVSKLMTRQATLAALYKVFVEALGDATKMTRFINNDLGLPYSPPGSAVTEEMLDACRRDFGQAGSSPGPCTMGVDVGSVLDIRISDSPENGVRRSRWIGRAPLKVDEIVGRLKKFGVRSCVIDSMPETHFCRQVLSQLGATGVRSHGVWLCRFIQGVSVRDAVKDPKERIVTVDRTQLLDAATARIRKQLNWLPRAARDLLGGDYYAHMQAPKRVLREEPAPPRYIWTKGVDHQRLADAYDELAAAIGGRSLRRVSGDLTLRLGRTGVQW